MRKIVLFGILAVFMLAAPVAMAVKKVDCCVNGKCHKVTWEKCTKMSGQVVKSCKQCNRECPGEKVVDCCVNGKCHKVCREKCDKMKGEVVGFCKECKDKEPASPSKMK